MGYFNPSLITIPSSVTPGSISSCDAFLNVFQSKGLRQEVICPCASSPEALTVAIRRYFPMIAEDSLGVVMVQYWRAAVLAVNLSEGSRAGPAFPRCWHGIFPSLGSPAGDTPHWHVADPRLRGSDGGHWMSSPAGYSLSPLLVSGSGRVWGASQCWVKRDFCCLCPLT